MNASVFETIEHKADLCVAGGGMTGLCAAIAAARRGAKVVLVNERPVWGGNASSEIRMHICGADRGGGIKNVRETGILEEIKLENLKRNPSLSYAIWDTVLYDFVKAEPNITPLQNCSVNAAETEGAKVKSVTGWQLTTETFHRIEAKVFADCSGEGVLAPLAGAKFRIGREARSEFDESIAPEKADKKTMGMTLMFEAEECAEEQPFTPPAWARKFKTCEELPYGINGHAWSKMGHWWIELGGDRDSIRDTEELRDELLKIVYGVWDHLKNHCKEKERFRKMALSWLQFLPGKRESRRYEGLHMLAQNEVREGGVFEDVVAYGGWAMDDHHPAGFEARLLNAPSTIFHESPSPYGIPFGILQSKNVENLMCAGRDASCTHAAMSSTRVMGTCAVMGQALGTAAALAFEKGKLPKDLTLAERKELQQLLLQDDCYLPRVPMKLSEATLEATVETSNGLSGEALRDGVNRPVGDEPHSWSAKPGDSVAFKFKKPREVKELKLVLDSALDKNLLFSRQTNGCYKSLPLELQKKISVEILQRGEWKPLSETNEISRRMIEIPLGVVCEGVKVVLLENYGAPESRFFLMDVR